MGTMMVMKTKTQLTDEQEAALLDKLRNLSGRNEEVIQRHAEAGLSMYGTDPRYPGDFVELAPDGRLFIVRHDNEMWVRVREVSAERG